MDKNQLKELLTRIAQDALTALNSIAVDDAEQRSRLFFVKGGADARVLTFPAPAKIEPTEDFEEGTIKFTEGKNDRTPN